MFTCISQQKWKGRRVRTLALPRQHSQQEPGQLQAQESAECQLPQPCTIEMIYHEGHQAHMPR